VALGDVPNTWCLKTIGSQEFLDRKVRKSYNIRTLIGLIIDDYDNKDRTCGEHPLLWIFWSPIFHWHRMKCHARAKLDIENLKSLRVQVLQLEVAE